MKEWETLNQWSAEAWTVKFEKAEKYLLVANIGEKYSVYTKYKTILGD